MRLFLILFVSSLLFTSCEDVKPDYHKLIQGNWECKYLNEDGDTILLNLYFSDSICHFFRYQDNINTFRIKNDLIEIETIERFAIDYPVRKHVLKIVLLTNNRLKISSLSGALNNRLNIPISDTLIFVKVKTKNSLHIRCVSFFAGSCCGPCPSFKLEVNPDNSIKFEKFYYSEKEESFIGKASPLFWDLLLDKIRYVDFNNWKEKYEAPWTDDRTCFFVFDTNKGIYKVSIYGEHKEPRALTNITQYMFSNYEDFDLKLSKESSVTFKHEKLLEGSFAVPMEEKTLQFIPN